MTYKVANLVKEIKPSKETQNKVYTEANTFVQSVQGKSFNDFANAAKKKNFNFSNPKMLSRFQGTLPGINSDQDDEVLSWAFDKKREKGETNIFTTGTGDYIVAYINGKQEAGLADPESVREQIEPIVRNKVLAKKIIEKINASKITTLDQAAKTFASQKMPGQINLLNPSLAGMMEPRVAGAAFGITKGKTSGPIEGNTGVYMVVNKGVTVNKQPGDAKQIAQALAQQNSQMFAQALLKSLQDNAEIKDYRIEVWDKAQAQ